jgi:hypothetical protein
METILENSGIIFLAEAGADSTIYTKNYLKNAIHVFRTKDLDLAGARIRFTFFVPKT